jgi:hypothetical protein
MVEVLDGAQEVFQVYEGHLTLTFSISASLAPNVRKKKLFTLLEASVNEAKSEQHLRHGGAADLDVSLNRLTGETVGQLELAASSTKVLLKAIMHQLV